MLLPGQHVGWPNTLNIYFCASDGAIYPSPPTPNRHTKPLENWVHFHPFGGSIYPIDRGLITVGFPRPQCLPLNIS